MTAAERRAMRRLEIENEELRRHFDIANRSSSDYFVALFETRKTLRTAYALLEEARAELDNLMANDPAFMHMVGKNKNGNP